MSHLLDTEFLLEVAPLPGHLPVPGQRLPRDHYGQRQPPALMYPALTVIKCSGWLQAAGGYMSAGFCGILINTVE